jgi:hypothetical protein
LDESDILNTIVKAFTCYEQQCGKAFLSSFKVNVIRDREGIPYGYGYLYVSNPEVYHILLGRNPDGSERKEILDHFKEMGVDLNNVDFWDKPLEDWTIYADAMEEVDLEPLVEVPPVFYTEKHQAAFKVFKQRLRAKGKKIEDLDYWHDDYAPIEIRPAVVKDVDISLEPHKLFTHDVPDWITEKMIYHRFLHFVQGKTPELLSRKKRTLYPRVSMDR